MKWFVNALWISGLLCVAGCGGSGSNAVVGENADQQAFQDYEAQQKAAEDAENAAMKANPGN